MQSTFLSRVLMSQGKRWKNKKEIKKMTYERVYFVTIVNFIYLFVRLRRFLVIL